LLHLDNKPGEVTYAGPATMQNPATLAPLDFYERVAFETARRSFDQLAETARLRRAEALLEAPSLFLLHIVVQSKAIRIEEMNEYIANANGWGRVIRLFEADLLDMKGQYIVPSQRGSVAYQEVVALLDLNSEE
jgi:hypothetical protein